MQCTLLIEELETALRLAQNLRSRIVLLVGPAGSGKTSLLSLLAEHNGFIITNLNMELSERLLVSTTKARAVETPSILERLIDEIPYDIVLLDNIELLFDTSLHLDPLRLLSSLSRNKTLIASWPGRFSEGKLSYAEPGHPEERVYNSVECMIVKCSDDQKTTG